MNDSGGEAVSEHEIVAGLVPETCLSYSRLLSSELDSDHAAARSHALSELLERQGLRDASRLCSLFSNSVSEEAGYAGSAWSELFVRGPVPPYETSYYPPNMSGHLVEIADIAGFYKAFGFEVRNERPDHLLAELEFATVLSFKCREAASAESWEAAEICSGAFRSFLADHLGIWVPQFADRIAEVLPDNPYRYAVASLGSYLQSLCTSLQVTPKTPQAAGGALSFDSFDEAEMPGCMGCPLPGERELQIPG
jgi:TorA maturation chaperone TorD